jgi:hypothetical protein
MMAAWIIGDHSVPRPAASAAFQSLEDSIIMNRLLGRAGPHVGRGDLCE